ncbi:MAG: hypothetical protein MJA83_13920 [Gammaproteobacteria bacterium]|nr:hypothetical protein [Gammaproteobacteria bacterium]
MSKSKPTRQELLGLISFQRSEIERLKIDNQELALELEHKRAQLADAISRVVLKHNRQLQRDLDTRAVAEEEASKAWSTVEQYEAMMGH